MFTARNVFPRERVGFGDETSSLFSFPNLGHRDCLIKDQRSKNKKGKVRRLLGSGSKASL